MVLWLWLCFRCSTKLCQFQQNASTRSLLNFVSQCLKLISALSFPLPITFANLSDQWSTEISLVSVKLNQCEIQDLSTSLKFTTSFTVDHNNKTSPEYLFLYCLQKRNLYNLLRYRLLLCIEIWTDLKRFCKCQLFANGNDLHWIGSWYRWSSRSTFSIHNTKQYVKHSLFKISVHCSLTDLTTDP